MSKKIKNILMIFIGIFNNPVVKKAYEKDKNTIK